MFMACNAFVAANDGCTPSAPPRHVLASLDVSGSAKAQKGSFLAVTVGVAEAITLDRDTLTLYRLDRDTREFYDGPVGGDGESLAATLAEETQAQTNQSRTLPAPFWREAARRAQTDSGPVYILLLSDGDNDDLRQASWDDMAASAKLLGENAHVRSVVLCGVRPANWARLRQCFAPLGDRLHLMAPGQAKTEEVVKALGL